MTTTQTDTNGARAGGLILPHMLDWPKIRERLAAAMADKDLGMRALARAAHISHATLSKFLSAKNAELDLATLAAIAGALEIPVEDLAGLEPAPAGAAADAARAGFVLVDHHDISPALLNPRKTFDDAKTDGLADSIRMTGLTTPLLIAASQGDAGKPWYLIDGERRWRAIQKLKTEGDWTGPVACRVLDPGDAAKHLLLALTTSIQREDLTPLEEAAAFHALHIGQDMPVAAIAATLGCSERHIQYRLKLLELSPAARAALNDGVIPAAAARHIARLEDPKQQALVDRVTAGEVAPSEEAVRQEVNRILSSPKAPAASDPQQIDLEDFTGAPTEAAERDPEHPAAKDRVYELGLGGPHYATIRCKPLANGGWTWRGNASLSSGGWGLGATAEQEESEGAAVLAGALSTAATAANHLETTTGAARHMAMLRKVLAWANGLIEARGGEPVPAPEERKAPAFTPPPPEGRLAKHSQIDDPAPSGPRGYEVCHFSTAEGPQGWPRTLTVRDKATGRQASYELQRIKED